MAPELRESTARVPSTRRLARALAIAVRVCLFVGVVAAYAVWPVSVGLLLLAACLLALSARAPQLAFVLALVSFGAEGTIKELLANEGSPLPLSAEALGALALDVVLFASIVALVARERGATVWHLWSDASHAERFVIALLAFWLLVSLPQIFQSGQPSRGLAGFRLSQAYVATLLGGAIAFAPRRAGGRLLGTLLAGLAAVTGYAALRGVIGPSASERSFALAKLTIAQYGPSFRDVGSFSSSVGMDSYLVPAAVFAFGCALLLRRHRALAWLVVGFSVIAIAASFGRGPLVATAAGMVFMTVAVVSARQASCMRKWALAGALLAVLGLGGSMAVLANQASPATRTHLSGVLSPGKDVSLRDRRHTVDVELRRIRRQPFGAGLGTVGQATRNPVTGAASTADDSYLKVFVEQGVLVGLVFIVALAGTCVVLARRLRPRYDERARLGIAALSGFVAFLVLLLSGEYIEQPGKVLAWALAGIAVSQTIDTRRRSELTGDTDPASGLLAKRARRMLGAWWSAQRTPRKLVLVAAAIAMAAIPIAFNLARAETVNASIEIFPVRVADFPAPSAPGYLLALLRSTAARRDLAVRAARRQVPSNPSRLVVAATTGVAYGGRRVQTLTITVSAPTPTRAVESANGRALAIVFASARDLAKLARARLERTMTRAQHEVLSRLISSPSPRFALGRRARATASTRWADRVVASLPGTFPTRPNPWAAGAGGLLLVAVAWLTLELLPRLAVPPKRRVQP